MDHNEVTENVGTQDSHNGTENIRMNHAFAVLAAQQSQSAKANKDNTFEKSKGNNSECSEMDSFVSVFNRIKLYQNARQKLVKKDGANGSGQNVSDDCTTSFQQVPADRRRDNDSNHTDETPRTYRDGDTREQILFAVDRLPRSSFDNEVTRCFSQISISSDAICGLGEAPAPAGKGTKKRQPNRNCSEHPLFNVGSGGDPKDLSFAHYRPQWKLPAWSIRQKGPKYPVRRSAGKRAPQAKKRSPGKAAIPKISVRRKKDLPSYSWNLPTWYEYPFPDPSMRIMRRETPCWRQRARRATPRRQSAKKAKNSSKARNSAKNKRGGKKQKAKSVHVHVHVPRKNGRGKGARKTSSGKKGSKGRKATASTYRRGQVTRQQISPRVPARRKNLTLTQLRKELREREKKIAERARRRRSKSMLGQIASTVWSCLSNRYQ